VFKFKIFSVETDSEFEGIPESLIMEKTPISEMFTYEPLPTPTSIRLLQRRGIDESGFLNFSLETVDLIDGPEYHCLSYSWGNPHADGALFRGHFRSVASEYEATNLHVAICNGRKIMIGNNLLEAMVQIPKDSWARFVHTSYPQFEGRTGLHTCARDGNSRTLLEHLLYGADIKSKDDRGWTALHYAADGGHLDCVKPLLRYGSDAECRDSEGRTAIDLALKGGHSDVVETFNDLDLKGESRHAIADIQRAKKNGVDSRIWIDAICIDQTNIEERNSQVAMMGRIYSASSYTLGWLGREDDSTLAAVDTLSKIVSMGNRLSQSSIIPYRTGDSLAFELEGLPHISINEWDALAALVSRQWFRRIWVIQEVVFAKHIIIYCGQYEIRWADLLRFSNEITSCYGRAGFVSSEIYIPLDDVATSVEYHLTQLNWLQGNALSRDPEQSCKQFSLQGLIMATLPFLATDPRDKIFALFSLSSLHPTAPIVARPDYSESLEICYARATRGVIHRLGDLSVLSWVQDSSIRNHDLPSWVPDFSLGGTNPLMLKSSIHPGVKTISTPAGPIMPEDRLTLIATGYEIDTVFITAAERPIGGSLRKFVLDPSWFEVALRMNTEGVYLGQSKTEVLWRTLCADHGIEKSESPAPSEMAESFSTLVCAILCADVERSIEVMVSRHASISSAIARTDPLYLETHSPIDEQVRQHRTELRQKVLLFHEEFDIVRPTLTAIGRLARCENFPPILSLPKIQDYMCSTNLHPPVQYSPVRIEQADGGLTFTIDVDASLEQRQNITEPTVAPSVEAESRSPFSVVFGDVYGRRRLFVTAKGYLGLGPSSLQVGDKVYILKGANVPFLLREQEREDSREGATSNESEMNYKLVGEAYIHGIMNGELFDKDGGLSDRLKYVRLV